MPVWDLSAASYVTLVDTSGQDTNAVDVAFSDVGTTMFVLGSSNHKIYQYTLSTGWDVSTATYASKSFDTGGQDISPTGIAFKPDGTTVYVSAGANQKVFQYSLSTAWDISTASYTGKSVSTSAFANTPVAVEMSSDGTKMYVIGSGGGFTNAYQYTLSTAWDVSTATSSTSFTVSQDTAPQGIRFKTDGMVMFILGASNDVVYQYSLSTAWNVSTASYTGTSKATTPQTVLGNGLGFRYDTGETMYVAAGPGRVYQWTLGVAVTTHWWVGSVH